MECYVLLVESSMNRLFSLTIYILYKSKHNLLFLVIKKLHKITSVQLNLLKIGGF